MIYIKNLNQEFFRAYLGLSKNTKQLESIFAFPPKICALFSQKVQHLLSEKVFLLKSIEILVSQKNLFNQSCLESHFT